MPLSRLLRQLCLLGVSFWLALPTAHPAQALALFSNQTIADTFDTSGTVRWHEEDAATRSAAQAIEQKVRNAVWRYQRQSAACGASERCDMRGWYGFLGGLRNASPLAKLDAVNRWVNRFPYVSDWQNWGVADYWESPAELIARGGQCEDYAMVKYLALRALGFADSSLRIVAVRDGAEDHAVLVVRLRGRLYLLDNLERDVVDSAHAPDYHLIYAVNDRVFSLYRNTEIPIPGSPVTAPPIAAPAVVVAAADPPPATAPADSPVPGVRPITTAEIEKLPPPVAIAATAPTPVADAAPVAAIAFAEPVAPLTQIAFASPPAAPTPRLPSPNPEPPASPY